MATALRMQNIVETFRKEIMVRNYRKGFFGALDVESSHVGDMNSDAQRPIEINSRSSRHTDLMCASASHGSWASACVRCAHDAMIMRWAARTISVAICGQQVVSWAEWLPLAEAQNSKGMARHIFMHKAILYVLTNMLLWQTSLQSSNVG